MTDASGLTTAGPDGGAPAAWVSVAAVAWVLDEAPVPADLIPTLIAIARYADGSGKGARPRVGSVVQATGKSESQIRREVAKSRGLGLLVLGDQSLTAHLPAGQRPVVYDIPLWVKGPKPAKESRNKSGQRKTDTDADTPRMDARGSTDARGTGSTHARGTGSTGARGRGSTDATQKNHGKNPDKNPAEQPLSPASPAAAASLSQSRADARRESAPQGPKRRTRESLDPGRRAFEIGRRILIRNGLDRRVVDEVYDWIELSTSLSTTGYLISAEKNDSIEDAIYDALASLGLDSNLLQ